MTEHRVERVRDWWIVLNDDGHEVVRASACFPQGETNARAVVAAMNGAGEPVAYQWRYRIEGDVWSLWKLCFSEPKGEVRPFLEMDVVPLYAAPPANPVAVVERLLARYRAVDAPADARAALADALSALKEAKHGG